MFENTFNDGLMLDIAPAHALSAMRLNRLGGALPKGERCSRTLFEKR
jgi:hypothetical protein